MIKGLSYFDAVSFALIKFNLIKYNSNGFCVFKMCGFVESSRFVTLMPKRFRRVRYEITQVYVCFYWFINYFINISGSGFCSGLRGSF